jgi:hypothetical protein
MNKTVDNPTSSGVSKPKIDRYYLLKYNALAHLSLVITYGYTCMFKFYSLFTYDETCNVGELWDKEYGRVSFLIGHMIISTAQLLLSYDDPGSIELRNMLLGMFGHALIMIYGFWKLNIEGVSYLDTFFLFLQGGMIYFYATHNNPDMGVIPVQDKLTRRDLYLFTFGCLCTYYVYMAIQAQTVKRYGLWAVASAYLVLIYMFFEQKPVDLRKKTL